jgi:hypothetical protein
MSLAHNQTKKRVYEKVFMDAPTNNDLMHFFYWQESAPWIYKKWKTGYEGIVVNYVDIRVSYLL